MKKTVKKIIITGAAGEVGLNIFEVLEKDPKYSAMRDTKKYSLIAIDKNKDTLKMLKKFFPYATTICADLTIRDGWEKNFKGAYAVIQLQAQISSPHEEPYINNNVRSVENVVDVCEDLGIRRLVHISSSVVISVAKDYYTDTKRLGETLVRKSKVPHIILRPTLMYGCYDIKHLGYLVKMFEKSPIFPMPGSGKYLRQPLYVQDFARIILNSLDMKMDNKTYNITGKEKIYLIDCLKKIFKAKNNKILFIKIPLPIFYFMIKVYGLLNRNTKIVPDQLTALTAGDIFPVIKWEILFDIEPTKFEDGVKDMLASKHYRI
jgi:nucleoside-diphosphate-sugar epimerase